MPSVVLKIMKAECLSIIVNRSTHSLKLCVIYIIIIWCKLIPIPWAIWDEMVKDILVKYVGYLLRSGAATDGMMTSFMPT